MSDAVRGLVILASVLLCLPVLPQLLAGELTTAEAGTRYAGALLLAWGGAALLAALVKAYGAGQEQVPPGEQEPGDAPAPSRRQDDIPA